MKEKIITVDNLSFSYGENKVLDNINFYIDEGDFVGIIGSNGSAKSTLLKLILGLLKPNEGNIKIFGKDINEFKDYDKIGYIPQNVRDFNQMFPATVEEVVASNLYSKKGLFKSFKKEDYHKIEHVLEIVHMEGVKNKRIGNLSGGQKQRVFIARALVNSPKILFMDEPLVGVDVNSQNKFYSLMEEINKKHNITLVMISHDIGIISQKVNRILCLNNGNLYCHDSNNCQCADLLNKAYGENMNILFHEH